MDNERIFLTKDSLIIEADSIEIERRTVTG